MNNVTVEVQRLLDERNVKYRLVKELGKDMFYLNWVDQCGDYTKVIRVQGACITAEIKYLSPEEAVAMTLGSKKAKAHPYGYEPDTGAFDVTRCECGCLNDISATYCNDCGGEIEVDMNAEKEIYYTPLHFVYAIKHDDGSLGFNGKRYVVATLESEREKQLELLVNQLWYLVNHRSGYGYAAALEAIEELGIEVDEVWGAKIRKAMK